MKKNKFMRVASVLLVLTLLSTCAISGTFAKYTTSGGAEDTARVAKWGVQISTSGDVFTTDYESTDDAFKTATSATYSVVSENVAEGSTRADVVAPGTSGTASIFSITGTPEVGVNIEITLNSKATEDAEDTLKMITLPKATYTDYTVANVDPDSDTKTTFAVDQSYNPIKWTLKRADTAEGLASAQAIDECNGVNLQAIETYLESIDGYKAANTDLTTTYGYYELSWTWDFTDADDAANVDKWDTYLGMVASGKITDTTVLLNEAFNLKVEVVQVD